MQFFYIWIWKGNQPPLLFDAKINSFLLTIVHTRWRAKFHSLKINTKFRDFLLIFKAYVLCTTSVKCVCENRTNINFKDKRNKKNIKMTKWANTILISWKPIQH